jgi:DNA-binding NarL/FixJ family response regulator
MADKILIADDHALIREGMRQLLQELAQPVTVLEAGDFGSAIRLIETHPDLALALLDLRMPDMDAEVALELVRQRAPETRIAVLSASSEQTDIRSALDICAVGYIPKNEPPEIMLQAIQLILSGGHYLPPELLQEPANTSKSPRTLGTPTTRLTGRQHEVLALLRQGKTNKEIALELGLSLATVKAHISSIFRALSVSNRSQAIIAAEKEGISP